MVVTDGPADPVLLLLPSLEIGGSETKFVNLASRLVAAGLPVHVAYLQPPEDLKDRLSGVPAIHLKRKGKWSVRAFSALSRYVEDQNIGTIVTVNPYPLAYAVPLAFFRKAYSLKVVASINTSEFLSRREERFMGFYAMLLRRCEALVFGSKSQKNSWVRRYRLPENRSRVIYNGVDSKVFDPNCTGRPGGRIRDSLDIPEDSYVVVSVGQFRPEKAHENLVAAIAALKNQRGMNLHLLMVGDGPEQGRIKTLVDQAGLNDDVSFVGVAHDVRPYLAASDLFVLTSTAVETFSNAALEAAAMGLPIVISDVGGAKEMFRGDKNSTIYSRYDIAALTSAIGRFVSKGPISESEANAVRERIIRKFSIGSMDSSWKNAIWANGSSQKVIDRNRVRNGQVGKT